MRACEERRDDDAVERSIGDDDDDDDCDCDSWTDGWMDGWMDGWRERRTTDPVMMVMMMMGTQVYGRRPIRRCDDALGVRER